MRFPSPFRPRRSARLAGQEAAAAPTSHPLADAGSGGAAVPGEEAANAAAAPPLPPPPQPDQQLPTASEIAAAEAARARLYGGGGGEVAVKPAPEPSGPPPPAIDVPLLATADLPPLPPGTDVPSALRTAAAAAASPDWAAAARALETLRRGVAHHRADVDAATVLRPALPAVVAAMQSLRSALCRAGLAAAIDLVAAFGRSHPWIVFGGEDDATGSKSHDPHPTTTTPLLPPLIAKAGATDKRFVVDAAVAALDVAADGAVDGATLATALLPRTADKAPRVRAAAGGALARTAISSGAAWPAATADAALAAAAGLVGDAWPPARAAGRDLAAALRAGWAGGNENAWPASLEGGKAAAAAPAAATTWAAHAAAVLGERAAAGLLAKVDGV